MTEEGYNGWKNYPTWCVNLWLANDEGLYAGTIARVRADMEIDAAQGTRRVAVADGLRDWVRLDLLPDLSNGVMRHHAGSGIASDLLGYALDSVDWFEIADAWIQTVGELDYEAGGPGTTDAAWIEERDREEKSHTV